MTAESEWARLRDLFDRAVGLDAGERDLLLERECADAPDLRRRIDELLIAHEAAAGFLAAPTESRASLLSTTRDADDPAPGAAIGPYKLLQRIGEGGFGVVYMAEQREPITLQVALKVIKLGMDTKQVIARFEAERQALALMDHPNIARIFGAGATDSGRPYFVMELVRGIPITDYCDRERFTAPQRLELFIPVCQAVAHAHQKGVIHRDLKPSNVMVTLHDNKPVPKVIDFGVARAIHQRLTERTLFTEYGQLIGTPEYMSPEQGEMSGLDVDTRSDVYSLGAMLYELLTGEKLFDPKRLRSLALKEIQRVLWHEEPPRPSARVSTLGVAAVEAARRRGVEAAQLVRLLRGDPDWIVMKAIAKERARRYDSAGALAADIERCLRAEPVTASPPGVAYRASRFVRRHRVAVAVVGTLVASLLIGVTVSTIGLVAARRAESRARMEARRNALDVEATRALLTQDEATYMARVDEAIAAQRAFVPMDTVALGDYLTNTAGLLSGLMSLTPGNTQMDSFRDRVGRQAIDVLLSIESPRPSTLEALIKLRDYEHQHYPDRLADIQRRIITLLRRSGASDSALAGDRRMLAKYLRDEAGQAAADDGPAAAKPVLSEAVEALSAPGAGSALELASARGELGDCLASLGEYAAAESLLLRAYRVLGARERLMRLVTLYERWGRPEKARAWAARTAVASIRELGALPGPPTTAGRGGGFSGRLGDRWIWVFRPVTVKFLIYSGTVQRTVSQGSKDIRWNSWSWTRDRDARDGITLRHAVDDLGAPQEMLGLTPPEVAERDTGDAWLNLEPAALIEDPARSRALLLYVKIAGGRRVGTSLAVWPIGAPKPRRMVVRAGSPEPTLLFQGDEPDFAAAALVVRDTLHLYGARGSRDIVLGRAPLAQALDRSAWRFYAGAGRWVRDVRDAAGVLNSALQFSVHRNEHLDQFVLMSFVGLGERLEMKTSRRPEGPWSRGEVILTALPPAPEEPAEDQHRFGWVSRPAVHAELARESGRVQYLTYERPMGFLDSELRLVEIVFK